MNVKITFAYDGSRFSGSQTQPESDTVQDVFEQSLKRIQINNKLILSGRTDKDVHSSGQVASLVLPSFWTDLSKLKEALLRQLPNSITISDIKKVDDSFHARFSAKKRYYRYIISSKPTTPFNSNYVYYHQNINIDAIHKAIELLKGTHDFEYFSKKGSDPVSTIREIFDIKFYKYKEFYIFKFKANAYLRSQIRMMVSFLLKISDGKLTLRDLENQIKKKELVSWTLAPANGLYLSKIVY